MFNQEILPEIDLIKTVFSRRGSYFVFSKEPATEDLPESIVLKTLHSGGQDNELLRLEITDGNEVIDYKLEVTASSLTMRVGPSKYLSLCISEPSVIRLKAVGVTPLLRFNILAGDIIHSLKPGWRFIGWQQQLKLLGFPIQGSLEMIDTQSGKSGNGVAVLLNADSSGEAELAIEEYVSEWETRSYLDSFENCAVKVHLDFENYVLGTPTMAKEFEPARRSAAYINWSAMLGISGHITRPATVMSNSGLSNVWNWDNFFNAMALSPSQPEMALDHLLVFYDNQAEDGQLPDYITDRFVSYTRAKPPLQGLTLRWLFEHCQIFGNKLIAEIYDPLVKSTEWWFANRESFNQLPHYYFASESGWDHCSTLKSGEPMITPDLISFLALQMETLSIFASRLGKPGESTAWKKRSDDLCSKLIGALWSGDCFKSIEAVSRKEVVNEHSLLSYLPLVLGRRLPTDVFDKLVEAVSDEERFLSPYGLVTESMSSPNYNANDNWMGAIWPPANVLIIDGLRRSGQGDLAKKIASRFCENCAKNGFPDFFNSKTGEPIRDNSYTWTSSVFQMLAGFYM